MESKGVIATLVYVAPELGYPLEKLGGCARVNDPLNADIVLLLDDDARLPLPIKGKLVTVVPKQKISEVTPLGCGAKWFITGGIPNKIEWDFFAKYDLPGILIK